MSQGEAMVAKAYDGLRWWVERGIDAEVPSDPNGVDAYRHLSYDVGWWEQGRLIGKARDGRWREFIWESRLRATRTSDVRRI